MRNTLLTILFLILYITTSSGMPDSLYYKLGSKGYELVLDMRYDEADEIFDEMIRMEPKNAVGYLYKSQCFFHCWQYTYLEPDKKTLKQFKSHLFKAKELAKEIPDKDDIETQFILGSAYGNIGLYYANINKWVRAFLNGRKGIRYIEKIIKKDPEYSNAYFLLGMYNYYAATLPKVVKSLSFLLGSAEGDREKGIEQLTHASLSGDLKGDARIFLADSVYYEEKDFEKASALLEKLTEEYPNNHYLRLILAVSYRELIKYDQSAQVLISSLKSESLKEFPYLHGHTYFALGVIYSRINEYDKAILAYENAYKIFKGLKGYIPDQHDALALFEIGNAYEMMGAYDRACEYYSKIKQNKKNAYENARERMRNPLTPGQIKSIKDKNYLRYGRYYKAEKN